MKRAQNRALYLHKQNLQAAAPKNMHVSARPFSLSQTTVR